MGREREEANSGTCLKWFDAGLAFVNFEIRANRSFPSISVYHRA